jgi:hypothetical protein
MKRVSQLNTLSQAASDDTIPILDQSTGELKRISVANLVGIPDFGWTSTGESHSFSSYSSTTKIGVVTVPSDATLKYSVGMKYRISQSTGGTKYGYIVAVTTTTISVYFGGYTLNNESISSPYYSGEAAPFGFTLSPASFASDALLRLDQVPDKQISTTTRQKMLFQTGGDYVTGSSGTFSTKSITFPVAFDTVLGVVVTNNGYKSSNITDVTDATQQAINGATANSVSTSGFTMFVWERDGSGNMGTNRFWCSWIAWGIKA